MAKFDEKKLPYPTQDRLMEIFCAVVCKLKTKDAVRDFFKDLMNRKERMMLIRRLQIAEMLLEKYTYDEIVKKLKCGTPTIARVERWLEFGRGGYKQAIRAKRS